jgi:hypothetical protein
MFKGRSRRSPKEAGVKLFVPSEFGGVTEGETEGMFGQKASIRDQLKAVRIPYALIYTGPFADYIWAPATWCVPPRRPPRHAACSRERHGDAARAGARTR